MRESSRKALQMVRICVAVGVGAAVALSAVTPRSAWAGECTLDRHCYGQVQSFPIDVDGVAATITPVCLRTGTQWDSFVTDEIWLASSGGSYWLEAGYIQNNHGNINGLGSGRRAFWAELTPTHDFVAHGIDVKGLPALRVAIAVHPRDRYTITYGDHSATTAINTMTPYEGIYGSETTTTRSRNRAVWTHVQYRSGGRWLQGMVRPLVTREQPISWLRKYRSIRAGNAC